MPLPWTTTLGQIRQIASEAVLGIPVGTNAARINLAIRGALLEYHAAVRPDRAVDSSLVLSAGSGSLFVAPVDYTGIADFTPERFLQAELEYVDGRRIPLETVDYATVYDALSNNTYLRTYPNMAVNPMGGAGMGIIGFDNNRQHLFIMPRVQVDTTIRMHYWRPLTAFDESTVDSTVVNVPDEHVAGILTYGVPIYYESKTLESSRLQRLRDDFKAFLKHCKSIQKFGGDRVMYGRGESYTNWSQ